MAQETISGYELAMLAATMYRHEVELSFETALKALERAHRFVGMAEGVIANPPVMNPLEEKKGSGVMTSDSMKSALYG